MACSTFTAFASSAARHRRHMLTESSFAGARKVLRALAGGTSAMMVPKTLGAGRSGTRRRSTTSPRSSGRQTCSSTRAGRSSPPSPTARRPSCPCYSWQTPFLPPGRQLERPSRPSPTAISRHTPSLCTRTGPDQALCLNCCERQCVHVRSWAAVPDGVA